MSDTQLPETFVLVDISSLEGTSFLKRASLPQIVRWAKIYGMDGRLTKRLDLITDVETLQYLYWNSTQEAPVDMDGAAEVPWDLSKLQMKCSEAASNLTVDETSVDELQSRIPSEFSESVQSEETNQMAELKKPKDKKGSKKAAAEKTEKAPKEKKEKAPVDHSKSNKAKVFAAVVKGETDIDKLVKVTGGAVKETTIRSWVASWYRGDNLPAVASDEDKTIIEAQGKKIAKHREAEKAEKAKAAEEEKAKKKADAEAKKKAEAAEAAKKAEEEAKKKEE